MWLVLTVSGISVLMRVLRGIKEYEPARFMTVNQCIEQLLEVENERKEGGTTTPTTASGHRCSSLRLSTQG